MVIKSIKIAVLLVVLLATPALANNPAVCRVRVPGPVLTSFGTGTCIYSDDNGSLLMTAYHVVQDQNGQITLILPSKTVDAVVLAVDKVYDLALLYTEDKLPAVILAVGAPNIGDTVKIIGYAAGKYRETEGVVLKYWRPKVTLPAHWFMVDHASRSGDSGGPILNTEGALVGVLFGSGVGSDTTIGTSCYKVRLFISIHRGAL